MSEDKINRLVMNRDAKPSSKQRKFYLILTGKMAPSGKTRGELSDLIAQAKAEDITRARVEFKMQKTASKYMRRLLGKLQGESVGPVSRRVALECLGNYNHGAILKAKRELRKEVV